MVEPPLAGSVQLIEILEVDYDTVVIEEGASGTFVVVTK